MASAGDPISSPAARTVKVSNLSANTVERDIRDFFSFCGDIERIALQSAGDNEKVAYVAFRNAHALETALLLSGATIVNQAVTITEVDYFPGDANTQTSHSTMPEASPVMGAIVKVQDVMASMLAKGYILGKDALDNARAFDERHRISSNATATVSSLDSRFGVTQTISSGTSVVNQHVRALDERFQVSEKTRRAFSFAEEKVASASSAVLNSNYVVSGASWVSGAFNNIAKTTMGEPRQKRSGYFG